MPSKRLQSPDSSHSHDHGGPGLNDNKEGGPSPSFLHGDRLYQDRSVIGRFHDSMLLEGVKPSTIECYIADVKSLRDYLGQQDKCLTDAGKHDIEAYIRYRYEGDPARNIKPNKSISIRRHLSGIQRFYDFLAGEQTIGENPVHTARKPAPARRKPVTVLRPDQIRALRKMIPEGKNPARLACIFELAHGGGLKMGEIVSLERKNIGLDLKHITAVNASGEKRIIDIRSDYLAEALEHYLVLEFGTVNGMQPSANHNEQNIKWVFPSRETQGETHITRQAAYMELCKLGQAAGMPVNANILRHTFAVNNLNRGDDPQHISQEMGLSTAEQVLYTYGNYKGRAGYEDNPERDCPPPMSLLLKGFR